MNHSLDGIGLGTAALGHLYHQVDDDTAEAVIHAAYAAGIRFFDTAHLYGGGLAEQRLGHALSRYPRESYRVCTKIGNYRPFGQGPTPPGSNVRRSADVRDFSSERTEVAIGTSLTRLRTEHIDIVHVHGFEGAVETARTGAFATLAALRDRGVVGAVGGGTDTIEPLVDAVSEGLVDAVLVAGRHSLIDRTAEHRLFPLTERGRCRVVVGGVFNSGILATGAVPDAHYNYNQPPTAVLDLVRSIERLCADYRVPLRAAALQFPRRHPAVEIMLLGPSSMAELEDCLAMLAHPIPETFWDNVDAIVESAGTTS